MVFRPNGKKRNKHLTILRKNVDGQTFNAATGSCDSQPGAHYHDALAVSRTDWSTDCVITPSTQWRQQFAFRRFFFNCWFLWGAELSTSHRQQHTIFSHTQTKDREDLLTPSKLASRRMLTMASTLYVSTPRCCHCHVMIVSLCTMFALGNAEFSGGMCKSQVHFSFPLANAA